MSFICRPVLCPGWVTGLSWDLPLTWYPVCDLFAIVGHPVSCATCSCQASMQIQLLLSKLETITHFLSPGKDFIKCEVAGWVVKHVWAILVSFGQTTLGALSCKINYCASFINVPAIKKNTASASLKWNYAIMSLFLLTQRVCACQLILLLS